MKRYLIINECFSSNLGDQAINKNLTNLFFDYGIKTQSIYLSQPLLDALPVFNYESQLTPQTKKNKNMKILKSFIFFIYYNFKYKYHFVKLFRNNEYEKIIIGGGQLFGSSQLFSPNKFSIALFWISKIAKECSKAEIIYVGVGSASKHGFFEKQLFKYALNKSSKVIVRDEFSKVALKREFGIESSVAPDVVFYSPLVENEEDRNRNLGLVFITDFEIVKKYNKSIFDLKAYYEFHYSIVVEYRKYGLEVLIAYTTLEDSYECNGFRKYIFDKYGVDIEIAKTPSLDSLISHLKRSQKLISGRMHALILGKKYGVQVTPFLLSEKLEEFSKEYLVMDSIELDMKLKSSLKSLLTKKTFEK